MGGIRRRRAASDWAGECVRCELGSLGWVAAGAGVGCWWVLGAVWIGWAGNEGESLRASGEDSSWAEGRGVVCEAGVACVYAKFGFYGVGWEVVWHGVCVWERRGERTGGRVGKENGE